jgi:hypothetical protein
MHGGAQPAFLSLTTPQPDPITTKLGDPLSPYLPIPLPSNLQTAPASFSSQNKIPPLHHSCPPDDRSSHEPPNTHTHTHTHTQHKRPQSPPLIIRPRRTTSHPTSHATKTSDRRSRRTSPPSPLQRAFQTSNDKLASSKARLEVVTGARAGDEI